MAGDPTILLCVGATKAGTTWLYEQLRRHPDCHLRAIKELHYFDALENGTFARQIKVQRAFAAKLALRGSSQAAAKLRDVQEWIAVLAQGGADPAAYVAYVTDRPAGKRLVADVTPAYALLPETRLRSMACMAPDVRFLYLLRDPVARLWSQIRMLAERTSDTLDAVPEAAFAMLEHVLGGARSGATERGDYAGAVTRLRAAVEPSRLLVMFHEDLLTVSGLARLAGWLGIGPINADLEQRVHAGVPVTMSVDQKARARAMLRPQYEFVARHYPDLPEVWRRNMEEAS